MSRLLRRVLRVIGYLFAVVVGGAVVLVAMAVGGFQRRFEVPDSALRASADPTIIVIPGHDLNLLGKVVTAFVVTPPPGPGTWPAASPTEEPTIERGGYVAEAVATCASCHTARSKTDGSFTGPRYAGGGEFEVEGEPTKVWVSPNLTPAESGWITQWTEDQFVGRFRSAVAHPKTPMAWRLYSRMSDVDLRAIYRYLRTLEPVETPLAPPLREHAP